MEEKVITVGDQELVEVLIKAVHLQGLSSIQEYKNIDKVTHQVKTNKHTVNYILYERNTIK